MHFTRKMGKLALLVIILISFQSCQKELLQEKSLLRQNESITSEQQLLKIHKQKVDTWIRLIPMQGGFKQGTVITQKTIVDKGLITTAMQIGNNPVVIYFLSTKSKFHVYGVNSSQLQLTSNDGVVNLYDFQLLNVRGLKYERGKFKGYLIYDKSKPLMDGYNNSYPKSLYSNKQNEGGRSASFIDNIRRFFCELFGGQWEVYPHAIDGQTAHCAGGTSSPQQTQSVITNDSGGQLGLIFANINNPNYFNLNSGMWYSVLSTSTAGGGGGAGGGSGSNIGIDFIDPICSNTDQIRSSLFILNNAYNQQPAMYVDGSLNEMLANISTAQSFPIIPWLLKAGANAAADALMQSLFIYLTEEDCGTFADAFGHSKFNKIQVGRSAAEGLISLWHTPGGKLGKAAFTAFGDVLVNLIDNRYGTGNYQLMAQDFMLGFFSDLGGGAAGDLASKYALSKIGKGLLNKFGVHYKTVTSWLGGGLQQINKSFVHNGQTITASRIMKGFAENKVAVIGRSMTTRVQPFANSLSNDLGHPVLIWQGFNDLVSPATNLANNAAWIKSLKEQGYTFYDVGLDPGYVSGQLNNGVPNLDEGPFYSMELNEIFR